VFQYIGT
jgi:hypothetical protein